MWLALALLGAVVAGATSAARAADVEAGRRKAEPCAPCHGPEGNSTLPTVPTVAGQPAFYLHWQLMFYRDGLRQDPEMSPFAQNLSDADMADLAAYYSTRQPRPRPPAVLDVETMKAGRQLVQTHHCGSCHSRRLPEPRYAPDITGLPYEYLIRQLRAFRAQNRGALEGVMMAAAQPLSDEEIEFLARYLASLPPATEP